MMQMADPREKLGMPLGAGQFEVMIKARLRNEEK
jgi:hypothetical protein